MANLGEQLIVKQASEIFDRSIFSSKSTLLTRSESDSKDIKNYFMENADDESKIGADYYQPLARDEQYNLGGTLESFGSGSFNKVSPLD